MLDALKKRFWKAVTTSEGEGGWTVLLDGRPLRTPAKVPLLLPWAPLAEAVAAEWDAVEGKIDPGRMHFTRLANAATDKVGLQRDEIVAMLAAYGETDLLCHRADSPEGLVERQNRLWDPILDWALRDLGLRFVTVEGILPGDQPRESIEALADWLGGQHDFALMALHDLIGISGSILLARAIEADHLSPAEAWVAARLDEDWQAENWGLDSIAVKAAQAKEAEFLRAAELLAMTTVG